MKKSQVISMDFIMTFVVYAFALSIFFFALKGAITDESSLDVQGELLFSRMGEIYDGEVNFLDGSRVSEAKFDEFFSQNQPIDDSPLNWAYVTMFKDFENHAYKRIDYCVYIEENTGVIIKYFGAGKLEDYAIDIGNYKCVDKTLDGNPYDFPPNTKPHCDSAKKAEVLLLSKPVLYMTDTGNRIATLKVLICAQK
jgi:hypothetical protein